MIGAKVELNGTQAAIHEWRRWVEAEIGGSPERIDAGLKAAIAALDKGNTQEEIIAAARLAATSWDSKQESQTNASNAALQQWRSWVEKNIGGSQQRIDAATRAALSAINSNSTQDQIVQAAQNAAAGWDRQNPPLAPKRNKVVRVLAGFLVLVFVLIVSSYLFKQAPNILQPAIWANEGKTFTILAVVDLLAIIAMINLFRPRNK
jgi:hypothetical protein